MLYYDTGGIPDLALDNNYSGPTALVLIVLECFFWLYVSRGIIKKVKKRGNN
tara:strand:+ start:86 stop:241 length:156 start_codon:yes stop_codon:yes gene_type:complete